MVRGIAKIVSEAISGVNIALETPLWAFRAEMTYLFTSDTIASPSKSQRLEQEFLCGPKLGILD